MGNTQLSVSGKRPMKVQAPECTEYYKNYSPIMVNHSPVVLATPSHRTKEIDHLNTESEETTTCAENIPNKIVR